MWKIAKKVIRFGQKVASHRAPAVMSHTVIASRIIHDACLEN